MKYEGVLHSLRFSESLSARRVWIEIRDKANTVYVATVTLREEGVD